MNGCAQDWPCGFKIKPHYHQCGQLIFASSGTLNVLTENGIWLVPPQRAVWMPPKQAHIINARTDATFRTVYVNTELAKKLYSDCRILFMTPLLREAILALVDICAQPCSSQKAIALCGLILEEISDAPVEASAIHLPIPVDDRVRVTIQTLLTDPTDQRNREEWAETVGASGRTIDRIFKKETGMSFGAWKRHLLLLEALKQLAENTPVTTVAFELGYSSVSSFNNMFKQTLGITPKRYYKDRGLVA